MEYSNSMPIGLSLAFASNTAAMDRFAAMTDDEKKEFIERSRSVMSKKEMEKLVGSLKEEEEKPDLHMERIGDIFRGPSIG